MSWRTNGILVRSFLLELRVQTKSQFLIELFAGEAAVFGGVRTRTASPDAFDAGKSRRHRTVYRHRYRSATQSAMSGCLAESWRPQASASRTGNEKRRG